MKTFCTLLTILVCSCESCLANSERIAFYFAKTEAVQGINGKALQDLKLKDAPFLTGDDILSYTWDNHTMSISANAMLRLPNIGEVGQGGKIFVVTVDGDRCYHGAFWSGVSSLAHFHPVILTEDCHSGKIHIYKMYPPSDSDVKGQTEVLVGKEKMTVPDQRQDEKLKRALEELGKLKEAESPNKTMDSNK